MSSGRCFVMLVRLTSSRGWRFVQLLAALPYRTSCCSALPIHRLRPTLPCGLWPWCAATPQSLEKMRRRSPPTKFWPTALAAPAGSAPISAPLRKGSEEARDLTGDLGNGNGQIAPVA